MKYHQIDQNLFIKNRAKFTAQMKPNSVAVFNSNDIYPVSADSSLPFEQHRDIFYLSGVDQEESILLLFPDAPYEHLKQILFSLNRIFNLRICGQFLTDVFANTAHMSCRNPQKRSQVM